MIYIYITITILMYLAIILISYRYFISHWEITSWTDTVMRGWAIMIGSLIWPLGWVMTFVAWIGKQGLGSEKGEE